MYSDWIAWTQYIGIHNFGKKKKKTYHNTFKLYYTHQYTRQEYNRLMYKNAVYIMTQLGLSEQGKVLQLQKTYKDKGETSYNHVNSKKACDNSISTNSTSTEHLANCFLQDSFLF